MIVFINTRLPYLYVQYVFLTMEAMTDAAVHLGFPRDVASKLVTATIRGSASYAQKSGAQVSSLRANVRNERVGNVPVFNMSIL